MQPLFVLVLKQTRGAWAAIEIPAEGTVYGAVTFLSFPMSIPLFHRFPGAPKAIVSWNPCSFWIPGTNNVFFNKEEATGQELKSSPGRTSPKDTGVRCTCLS